MLSIYILISLQLWYKMKGKQQFCDNWTLHLSSTLTWRQQLPAALDLTMQFATNFAYSIEIFSDYLLWVGVTVLVKKIKIFYI